MDSSGMYAISVLVDEMKSEDTEARISAMRKVKTIALALGAERTRDQLVPFLNEQVEDDDEVLLVMAEELGGFVPLVGGPPEAVCLMGPLGALATVEETVVRDKAVESACTVIQGLDSAAVVEHVLPVITKLAQGDWFTARVSACGLVAAAYARLSDAGARAALRGLYSTLTADDTPMVRRAAAKHVGGLADVVERDALLAELLPLFVSLAGDDQDSVRLLAIENCTAFARVLSPSENAATILPLVKACAGDKSWRVRNNVAKEFAPLSEAMGLQVTRSDLLPAFVKLLRDPEAEVRASAAKNVAAYAGLVGHDMFLSDLLPAVNDCVVDVAQNVRTAAGQSLMEVAATLDHDTAVGSVLPLILQCLRDEAPEVRLTVLESLGKVTHTLGATFLETAVLPTLQKLGEDPLWRVREQVIQQMAMLAGVLGSVVFEEKLLPMYLATYQDQVNAVRVAATQSLQPLARTLGGEWVREKLVPRLIELFHADGSSYLQRITVLYGVRDLCAAAAAAPVDDKQRQLVNPDLLALLLTALHDVVANVRFVAAQVLEVAASTAPSEYVAADVRPALAELAHSDPDTEVRYFASRALEHC